MNGRSSRGAAPFHLPRDAKTLPLLLRTYGSGYCLQEVIASGLVSVKHLPVFTKMLPCLGAYD